MVTVDEILSSVSSSQKEVIHKLRSVVLNIVPDVEERVRQETISYSVGGKDFMRIKVFTDHVDAEFMCGARLTSANLKDRGYNPIVKHLEMSNKQDIDDKQLKDLIEEASKTVC